MNGLKFISRCDICDLDAAGVCVFQRGGERGNTNLRDDRCSCSACHAGHGTVTTAAVARRYKYTV